MLDVPAKAVFQARKMLDVLTSSLASQLLQVHWVLPGIRPAVIPCGSELARDGGLSGEGDAGCAGLIAGKPAPMYGLAPTVYPLLKNRRPVASMYKAYSWKPSSASGQ
ncbi:hypothetical protein SOP85_04005, partial [Pseudomonas sp. YuFO20]|nr:hypothetical protein [Pseudomonas sp. YuFO20]